MCASVVRYTLNYNVSLVAYALPASVPQSHHAISAGHAN